MRTPVCFLMILLAVPALDAQVPQGFAAIPHFKSSTAGSADGGVYVHSLNAALYGQWISGLGPALTGAGTSGVLQGAASVLIRASDGALIVGPHVPYGQPVDIHLVQLNGYAVATDTLFPLGISNGGGNVDQMAWLPDGRVLFVVRGIQSGAFASNRLGILDLTTGTLTPVPVSGLTGTTNALAVNAAGTTAYIGCFNSPVQGSSRIHAVPLPGGGIAAIAGTMTGSVLQLAAQDSGMVIVGLSGSVPAGLLLLDPANGATVPLHPTVTAVNALAIDRTTGDLWFTGGDWGGTICGLLRLDTAGALTTEIACSQVPGGPGGGPGPQASGLAMFMNPHAYGPATATLDSAAFLTSPNPGGAPYVGNLGFSLTVTSALGIDPGIFILGTQPANDPTFGFTLLVDPASAWIILPLAPAPVTAIALPIPADPQISGLTVYAQAGFAGPGGVATTPGLRIVVR